MRINIEGFRTTALSIGSAPTELHGISQKSKSITLTDKVTAGGGTMILDANLWLPGAAEEYNISPHLSDYILVPVADMVSDIPNTNGDSVSHGEFMRFNTDQGMPTFRTWKGKPTHVEHQNKDLRAAKGVIFDVLYRPLKRHQGQHYKTIKLLGFDRSKDDFLVNRILTKQVNTYSMGMWYRTYRCSVCGAIVRTAKDYCPHMAHDRRPYQLPDGSLAFRQCQYVTGFETSVVGVPAYVSANSDTILDPRSFPEMNNANKNTR